MANFDIETLTTDQTECEISLDKIDGWTKNDFESFLIYLNADKSKCYDVFYYISKDVFLKLKEINVRLFKDFSLLYLGWTHGKAFLFDYADVVVSFINLIYNETDDVNLKSHCVIAAAKLGDSHNRWYVMRHVHSMADQSIDERLARRIAIELSFNQEFKDNLMRCAKETNVGLDVYHRYIQEKLEN